MGKAGVHGCPGFSPAPNHQSINKVLEIKNKSLVSNKKKVIYFLAGPVPSAEQIAAAEKLGSSSRQVVFRNATQVRDGEALEKCDFVAGNVPKQYTKVERLDEPELPLGEGEGQGNENAPVAMTEANTKAEITDALAAAGIEVPASAKTKADLLALFPA